MKHQLNFAIQNLKKSKLINLLNVVGLTSAFTAFLLIMLYVWNEYQFDHYNANIDEIYRLEMKSPDNPKSSIFMMGLTGEALKNEIPEIIETSTYMAWGKFGKGNFKWENEHGQIKESVDYAYSDEKLTQIFSFNFILGEQDLPLKSPESAIISESFAKKAWGSESAVGKHFVANGINYTVTAVFEDLPENSVIRCPVILNKASTAWIEKASNEWSMTNYPQFLLVKPGTDAKLLTEKINRQSIVTSKYNAYVNSGQVIELIARPLKDLRFTKESMETPISTTNSKIFVDSLFFIGILVLLVALINYINFSTANIPKRIKSISIARIIGSSRRKILQIFAIETLILFAFSFGVSLLLAFWLNIGFSESVLGYQLPFETHFGLILICGLIAILFGIIFGLYPAIFSISKKPVSSIKGLKLKINSGFRGSLTIAQFVATIALIVASVTVIKQVKFMEESDVGYDKRGTLVLGLDQNIFKNRQAFEDRLKASPGVKDFAYSLAVPGQAKEMRIFEVNGERCQLWFWAVDDNYIDMMDFELVAGRNFIKDSEAENGNIICNESTLKQYGWEIGQVIDGARIVGVLKDFNFISLREGVDPFAFWYSKSTDRFHNISIKLEPGRVTETLAYIKAVFNEFSPNGFFNYFFLDDRLNALYAKENQQVKLTTAFSFLSVIISILGIFGLSVFIAQFRIKEIGVRKVNGAKVSEVLAMLNRDFIKWVAIAFAIACPIAYFAMNKWLENFAYRTNVSWWIFALAGVLALGIALLTVSWQSWKAATRNPVESLRYE